MRIDDAELNCNFTKHCTYIYYELLYRKAGQWRPDVYVRTSVTLIRKITEVCPLESNMICVSGRRCRNSQLLLATRREWTTKKVVPRHSPAE